MLTTVAGVAASVFLIALNGVLLWLVLTGACSLTGTLNACPPPRVDDYLKTIYHHTEWQDDRITPSQLAAELGLAPSSVTEMVQKLAAQGLVTHRPYGPIALTPTGEHRAAAIIRRHRLIETWLVREFGYALGRSARRGRGARARAQRPAARGHRRARSAARGSTRTATRFRMPRARCTASRSCCSPTPPPGHAGRVLRVSDRDPELLRAVEAAGVDVGADVTVTDAATLRIARRRRGAAARRRREAVWLTA